ncbi:hypothetical protein [Allonocardiopsis opalescens]|uniref:Uncharacterized protein n=1 Tax=Allonocardiopsis opalescens TaxID=1144618 RepID=A0A2T0PX02_9ACTN|nr:hypothetical protein [Allonocardiopsis opalescens]PRX96067.1 hypothetical protein CLV72_10871 [Allonocardiopsis opalescens]
MSPPAPSPSADDTGAAPAPPETGAAAATAEPRGLSRTGRALRLVACTVCLALLTFGTFFWDDFHFPFGPFRMYSTRNDPNGTIQVAILQGRTESQDWHDLPFHPDITGVNRAEVEGQIPLFEADPDRLSVIADAMAAQQPHLEPLTGVRLINRYHLLEERRLNGHRDDLIAVWEAP